MGEKFFFIDSDDYLGEDYFDIIGDCDADLVIGNYTAFYPDGTLIRGNINSTVYDSLHDYLMDFHKYFATVFSFAWWKIYDAEIIRSNALVPASHIAGIVRWGIQPSVGHESFLGIKAAYIANFGYELWPERWSYAKHTHDDRIFWQLCS